MRVKVAEQMVLTVSLNLIQNNALTIHGNEPGDYSPKLTSLTLIDDAAGTLDQIILENYLEIPSMIRGGSRCIDLRSCSRDYVNGFENHRRRKER